MGSLLSHPVTSKLVQRYGSRNCRIGFAEMQGYRPTMEDAHNMITKLKRHPDVTYMGIFDGHGDTEASEYVAATLPDTLSHMEDPTDPVHLTTMLEHLDERIIGDTQIESGTTACVALIRPLQKNEHHASSFTLPFISVLTVANIGDSRCLVIDSHTGHIKFHTLDHKPTDTEENRRIIAAGGYVADGRVDGDLAMSRALGDRRFKQGAELEPTEQRVIATATTTRIFLTAADVVLVSCDGIVENLTNEQVAAFIHQQIQHQDPNNVDPGVIVSNLLNYCLQSGSKDNMSASLYIRANGNGYGRVRDDFYLATSDFMQWQEDLTYRTAFLADAEKHGVNEEDVWSAVQRSGMFGYTSSPQRRPQDPSASDDEVVRVNKTHKTRSPSPSSSRRVTRSSKKKLVLQHSTPHSRAKIKSATKIKPESHEASSSKKMQKRKKLASLSTSKKKRRSKRT